jgi:chromosome partitioning protein
MRVIAFMNQKGGVGKTTTAVNVGAALAEMGARVLLIDLDSQTNLTTYLGVKPDVEETPDVFSVLADDLTFPEAIVEVDRNLHVVAGSRDLANVDLELADRPDRATVLRDRMAAGPLPYDYIILDCPPSLGLLTVNALTLAGEVVIPMQAHFLAMQGMVKLLETVRAVQQQLNPRLRIAGVVLTMFDGNVRLSNEVVQELDRFFESSRSAQQPWSEAKLFRTRIRRNIKLTESPSFGTSVLKYDPQSNGAADYRALAREIASLRHTPSPLERPANTLPKPRTLTQRALDAASAETPSLNQVNQPKPAQSSSHNPVTQATVQPVDPARLAAARVSAHATTQSQPAPATSSTHKPSTSPTEARS